MGFAMVDPQGQMLHEITDSRLTRDDVAMTYAFAIRQGETDRLTEVNCAIRDRWSMNALRYIKEKAWRLVVADRDAATASVQPASEVQSD